MNYKKYIWTLRLTILLSLALAILSLVFFEKQIDIAMGIRQDLVDYVTVYVGIFLAVFILSKKSFFEIVKRIRK